MFKKRKWKYLNECWIGSDICKCLVNHSFFYTDHKYFYHFTNPTYDKVKYIWLFKRHDGLQWFSQFDYGVHKHLGTANVGNRIEKIIKVEMKSEDALDAVYTVVWDGEGQANSY